LTGLLDQLRRQAGWSAPLRGLVLGVVGGLLLVFVAIYVASGQVLAGASGVIGAMIIFWAYVKRRIHRRTALFETQFVAALELAARSLRAGHPLVGAFRLISEEINPPVGAVFIEVCQQQEMGVSLDSALRQVAAKSNSSDMRFFATSVAIQLRSGGNLADMMERLSCVIRDRMRLSRRVRVLTAQTQFSKHVLAALPLLLFALLSLLNPRYVEPLYATRTGQLLLAVAAGGVLTGMYVMSRMAVLRY
jgi:tight adherence protein B